MTSNSPSTQILPTPQEMIAYMDLYVYGQALAKRQLATAVYNHYIGLAARDSESGAPIAAPQHVLLLGPTGVGKTYLIKILARLLGVPFAFVSATSLVQTGYVGTPVENIVRSLVDKASGDIHKAERGFIFVDEIDKVRLHGQSSGPDVSGEGVQIGFLTILDGRLVSVEKTAGEVDTGRILFICGGAFVGLEEIVEKRQGSGTAGFHAAPNRRALDARRRHLEHLIPEDLIEYGFIPELLGRFASFAVLEPLGVGDLVHILEDTRESVLHRKREFWTRHGIKLEFPRETLVAVAEAALQAGSGARALNRIVESTLDEIDWRPVELAREGVMRIVIKPETVTDGAAPKLHHGPARTDADLPVTELRRRALIPSVPNPEFDAELRPGISDTRDWSDSRVREAIEEARVAADWEKAKGGARLWWSKFESEHSRNPKLILRLLQELIVRKATIYGFFKAYRQAGTDNVQANLYYYDYTVLKELEEKRQEKQREKRAKAKSEEDVFASVIASGLADEADDEGSSESAVDLSVDVDDEDDLVDKDDADHDACKDDLPF